MCFLYNFITYLLYLLFLLAWQCVFGNIVMETLIAFLSGLMMYQTMHIDSEKEAYSFGPSIVVLIKWLFKKLNGKKK